jgi:hypothetical protein
MKTRHNILATAWTGAPLTLAGREMVFSSIRYEILKSWGNVLLSDTESDQSQNHAMHEIALLCYSTKEEIKELRKMTADDRHKAVVDFMLDFEEELPGVIEGLVERITATRLSAAESEGGGKQEGQTQIPTG